MSEVTRILAAVERGDPHAAEQLLPLVYDELRKLAAARHGAGDRRGRRCSRPPWSTRRTCGWSEADAGQHWNGRGHFFAAAAEAMRRILVETARRKPPAAARRAAGTGRTSRRAGRVARPPRTLARPGRGARRVRSGTTPRRRGWSSSATSPGCRTRRPRRPSASPAGPPTGVWAYARAWLYRQISRRADRPDIFPVQLRLAPRTEW